MSDFSDFLNGYGVENPDGLVSFIEEFMKDPYLFYKLKCEQRDEIEKDMNKILNSLLE